MAGILKVDQVQSDSNLAFNIAGSNVAFMNATSLQMVGSNVSLAGTNVITNGKLVTAAQPVGAVLQVVQANSTTYGTTTSATYQQSALTVTITPTSSSSKVLVQVQTQIGMAQSNWSDIALFRNNTTNLSGASAGAGIYAGPSSGTFDGHGVGVITFLDSPATTSATIYTMFWRSRNGSGQSRVILDSMLSTITATEIAG